MSKIALTPNASGTGVFTIAAPNTSTDRTLTLPDSTGTIDTLGRAGNVLQVVSAEFTSQFSTTSTSLVDSGFSASITPSSASNKILVIITVPFLRVQGGASGSSAGAGIAISNGAGTILYDAQRDGGGVLDDWTEASGSTVRGAVITKQMLHSPNTTSSYTYKVYAAQRNGGDIRLNFSNSSKTVITLMEIAA